MVEEKLGDGGWLKNSSSDGPGMGIFSQEASDPDELLCFAKVTSTRFKFRHTSNHEPS